MNGPRSYQNRWLVLVILAALASGCASSAKRHHSSNLGILTDEVVLRPHHVQESGQRLAATRANRSPSRAGVAAVPVSEARQIIPHVALRWPLKEVQITSAYGQRGREFHEGLDLRAKVGTPVFAAHAGKVLYSNERIRGYGRMIVIRHTTGLATIYAHNSRLVVRKGQWVAQGALIAYTGNTGHSHGPHLHFEVRAGVSTINPLTLLPRPALASRGARGDRGASSHFVAQQ